MIHIFKTSVQTRLQVKDLEPHINKILPNEKWNFDLEDCDKILRIECEENLASKIMYLLNFHQFNCTELV